MRRPFALLLAAVASAATVLLSSPAHAATSDGLYRLAWQTQIYAVENGVTRGVGGHEWLALGAPAPRILEAQFTKTPDDPRIRAEAVIGNLTIGGVLTFDEWRLAGYPAPIVVPVNSVLVKYRSGDDLFLLTSQQPTRRIGFQEWAALGFWYPQQQSFGQYQLGRSADPTIVSINTYSTLPPPALTFQQWSDLGFPAPARVNRFVNGDRNLDRFGSYEGDPAIYYTGPTMNCHHLTPAEWAAAGYPAPERFGGAPIIGTAPCNA